MLSFLVASIFTACGGGGAAVAPLPDSTTTGTTAPAPVPTAPSPNAVTTVGTSFSPAVITVAPGGTVVWLVAGATHNVTFGPGKPTGGDIPDTPAGNSVSRTFSSPGTYPYQCTRHTGMTGQVIVQDGAAGPTPSPAEPKSAVVIQASPSAFTPSEVEIAAGSSVAWEFVGSPNGVVFKDRSPDGGNISESAIGSRVTRTFSASGDYDYYSSHDHDVKGRIRVK